MSTWPCPPSTQQIVPFVESDAVALFKDPHLDAPDDLVLRWARLALSCTAIPAASRPSMNQVLGELVKLKQEAFGARESHVGEAKSHTDMELGSSIGSSSFTAEMARADTSSAPSSSFPLFPMPASIVVFDVFPVPLPPHPSRDPPAFISSPPPSLLPPLSPNPQPSFPPSPLLKQLMCIGPDSVFEGMWHSLMETPRQEEQATVTRYVSAAERAFSVGLPYQLSSLPSSHPYFSCLNSPSPLPLPLPPSHQPDSRIDSDMPHFFRPSLHSPFLTLCILSLHPPLFHLSPLPSLSLSSSLLITVQQLHRLTRASHHWGQCKEFFALITRPTGPSSYQLDQCSVHRLARALSAGRVLQVGVHLKPEWSS
ncbi:unnamed protein product [Closterium sp. NIES-65]|nr:unnamed protein product [Closterium sp. NIES-65]